MAPYWPGTGMTGLQASSKRAGRGSQSFSDVDSERRRRKNDSLVSPIHQTAAGQPTLMADDLAAPQFTYKSCF